MPQRSRIIMFLALPLAIFFWIFGWSLYWIDTVRGSAKLQMPSTWGLTFGVLIPEKQKLTH